MIASKLSQDGGKDEAGQLGMPPGSPGRENEAQNDRVAGRFRHLVCEWLRGRC